jgi:hypothetical protein
MATRFGPPQPSIHFYPDFKISNFLFQRTAMILHDVLKKFCFRETKNDDFSIGRNGAFLKEFTATTADY